MKYVAALGLTLVLAACGGGGGSAGTPITGSGSTATPPDSAASTPVAATVAVSDFVLLLSKNSINNSGTDSAQLTVTSR